MVYRRKALITNKDMVVLHLSTFTNRYQDSPDVPLEITQVGIADAIGVTRQNVPRTINALLSEGMIDAWKAHVIGFKLKRAAYRLTSQGISYASGIRDKLSVKVIEVSSPEGTRWHYIKDICDTLPVKVRLIDIVRETKYSKLNLENLLVKEMQTKKQFLDYSNGFHMPKTFLGREKEIDIINSWFKSDNARLLAVKGIAGIGKTTLVAEASGAWHEKYDMFRFKIHPWTALQNLVLPLAEFLSNMGKPEILAHIQAHEDISLADLHLLFEKILKDIEFVQIYDDCHNANLEVQQFLKMMHVIIQNHGRGKMVVVGRSIPKIYTRQDVTVSGSVAEIQLEGLDRENSRELLLSQNVPIDYFDSIFNQTKGHPLMLELSQGSEITQVGDVQKFVLEEFLTNLSNSERELLDYLSIFRYTINEKMACPDQLTFGAIVSKGILHELPDNRFQLHDAVKSHLCNSQRKKRLLDHHSRAADYYLEQGGEQSLLETIYHRIKAEQFDLAAEIAIEYRDMLCNSGNSRELTRLVTEIFEKCLDMDKSMSTALHVITGECMIVIGDWDKALGHFEDAIALGKKMKSQEYTARAHLGSGEIYQHRSDMKSARIHLQKALELFEKLGNQPGLARTYYQFGVIHERVGEYKKSLLMFKECKDLAEKESNPILLAKALNAFGRIQIRMGNDRKAKVNLEEAVRVLERCGYYRELAKTHCGLGILAFNRNDNESAINHFSKAEGIAETIGDLRTLGHALMNLSSAYLDKSDLICAVEKVEKAKEMFTLLGEKRMLGLTNITHAAVLNRKGKWKESAECLNISIKLLNEIGDLNGVAKAKYRLGIVYGNMEKKKNALEKFEEAKTMYKMLGNTQIIKEIDSEIKKIQL